MSAVVQPIPARHKNVNRAEVCDQNFAEFVQNWRGEARRAPRMDEPVLPGSLCTAHDFAELHRRQVARFVARPAAHRGVERQVLDLHHGFAVTGFGNRRFDNPERRLGEHLHRSFSQENSAVARHVASLG